APRAEPAGGRVEQPTRDLDVVLELEKAEPSPARVVVVVERVVDLRGHPPDHAPIAPGEEVGRLAVAEEGVQPAGQEQPPLELQRWHPQRVVSMQSKREVDEALQV